MSNPLISVVMNCYNGEKYLREAIESIFAQTYPQWELVFWDNRSTDGSAAIVQSYADNRIRYLLAPNHTHLGSARRQAVNECRGEFISFLDTDDIYLPENLSRKLEFIQRRSAAVVYGGVIYINEAGEERRRGLPQHHPSGMIFDRMLRQFEVNIPTLMIRRSVLLNAGLNFDGQIIGSEEYDLLMQLAVMHRFTVVPEFWAKLRFHRTSLTYQVIAKWATDRVRTLDKICARHPGIEKKFPAGFEEAYARAGYYRARWLVQAGRRDEALGVLRKLAPTGWKYRVLHLTLLSSSGLWDFVHRFLPSSRQL